jgi:hypothetical protein
MPHLALPRVWHRQNGAAAAPVSQPEPRLEQLLAVERWRPTRVEPELRKALAYVEQVVTEARQRIVATTLAAPTGMDAVKNELRELLRGDCTSIDDAWELYTALKKALVLIRDPSYLGMLLEREAVRNLATDKWHRWADHFPLAELAKLRRDLATASAADPAVDHAINRLSFLYDKRAEAGRDRRARAAEKRRALNRLAPMLFALLLGFGAAIELVNTGGGIWRDVLLATTAGALGSMLAGILKLRDQLNDLDDMRAFWGTIRVQPFVGATAGLIVLLIVQSGLLKFGGTEPADWSVRALIAFLAGFSEPFFLGLVQKVAVVPDRPAVSPQK